MNFNDQAEAALIAATRQIAQEEIIPRFRNLSDNQIESKSRDDDLVTIADKRSEERLTEVVHRILPGAKVVGEEAVAADETERDSLADAEMAVIIDPVDGTFNFANGLPLFGVILAVSEYGETTWGMIYDPVIDDWVMARRGAGCWFVKPDGTRRPIVFKDTPSLEISAMRGYAHASLFYGEERKHLYGLIPEFARIDALRCSAHEYRTLVQGGADFTLSPMLNAWDHAAGCLMVEEAGGVAKLLDGQIYRPGDTEGRLLVAKSEQAWDLVANALDQVGIKHP